MCCLNVYGNEDEKWKWRSNTDLVSLQRSNEVKITERAVRLELSLQHRPDAILNLGGLFQISEIYKHHFYGLKVCIIDNNALFTFYIMPLRTLYG